MLIVRGGEELPQEGIIPTPSFGLNYILGGGLWTSRYHIFWGEKGAGKSTLALWTVAEAQRMGYLAHIIDTEGSLTDKWSLQCGIDLENRVAAKGATIEGVTNYIREVLRKNGGSGQKNIFLIDSLNPLVHEAEYAEKADSKNQSQGAGARGQKFFIQRIHDMIIQDVNSIVILVAQQSMSNSGLFWFPSANIGKYTEHMASNIVRVTPSHAKDDNEYDKDGKILRRKVNWIIEKSKQAAVEGTKGEYYFSPDDAYIDWKAEVIDIAVRNDLIEKSGSWFTWDGEKFQGAKRLYEVIDKDNGWDYLKTELSNTDLQFDSDNTIDIDSIRAI